MSLNPFILSVISITLSDYTCAENDEGVICPTLTCTIKRESPGDVSQAQSEHAEKRPEVWVYHGCAGTVIDSVF